MQTVRGDTAIFFESGRAWMSDLLPYYDFTDSKGPLLWLIYGLGYLISPHSFQGVFLFEVFFYWASFFVIYRIGKLLALSDTSALLAAMAMGLLYFFPGMHQEVRVEDFCHLFQALTLYAVLQILYTGNYRRKYAFAVGVCCGAAMLMKYSIFFTLLIPTGFLALYLIRNKKTFDFILFWLIGLSITILPFLLYFVSVGILDDFINEYFVNTAKTIIISRDELDTESTLYKLSPLKALQYYRLGGFCGNFLMLVLVLFVCGLYRFKGNRFLMLIMTFWYTGSVLLYGMVGFYYYFFPLCIFAAGGLCWCAGFVSKIRIDTVLISGALMLALLAVINANFIYGEFFYTKRDREISREINSVTAIINEREKQLGRPPTVVYRLFTQREEVVQTNALPGARYWFLQNGMTEEMLKQHDEDIFKYLPDFVIVKDGMDEIFEKRLESAGYQVIKIYEPRRVLWENENKEFFKLYAYL